MMDNYDDDYYNIDDNEISHSDDTEYMFNDDTYSDNDIYDDSDIEIKTDSVIDINDLKWDNMNFIQKTEYCKLNPQFIPIGGFKDPPPPVSNEEMDYYYNHFMLLCEKDKEHLKEIYHINEEKKKKIEEETNDLEYLERYCKSYLDFYNIKFTNDEWFETYIKVKNCQQEAQQNKDRKIKTKIYEDERKMGDKRCLLLNNKMKRKRRMDAKRRFLKRFKRNRKPTESFKELDKNILAERRKRAKQRRKIQKNKIDIQRRKKQNENKENKTKNIYVFKLSSSDSTHETSSDTSDSDAFDANLYKQSKQKAWSIVINKKYIKHLDKQMKLRTECTIKTKKKKPNIKTKMTLFQFHKLKKSNRVCFSVKKRVRCKFGTNCKFAHYPYELKINYCKYDKRCNNRSKCPFKHSIQCFKDYYKMNGF